MIRTEKEILKDFEKLGYRIENRTKFSRSKNSFSLLKNYKEPEDNEQLIKEIVIDKFNKTYECFEAFYYCPLPITLQEHKLLNELFICWGWL